MRELLTLDRMIRASYIVQTVCGVFFLLGLWLIAQAYKSGGFWLYLNVLVAGINLSIVLLPFWN